MRIFDLNVWLHAINADSPHHASASRVLRNALEGTEPVGLPWVVALGFLRLTTSPRMFARPLAPAEAMALLDGWMCLPCVERIAPGREHWPILKELLAEAGTAANLTTDAHLAALAIERGATVVTFDRDFRRFARLKVEHP